MKKWECYMKECRVPKVWFFSPIVFYMSPVCNVAGSIKLSVLVITLCIATITIYFIYSGLCNPSILSFRFPNNFVQFVWFYIQPLYRNPWTNFHNICTVIIKNKYKFGFLDFIAKFLGYLLHWAIIFKKNIFLILSELSGRFKIWWTRKFRLAITYFLLCWKSTNIFWE